jgi:hypothetical protein
VEEAHGCPFDSINTISFVTMMKMEFSFLDYGIVEVTYINLSISICASLIRVTCAVYHDCDRTCISPHDESFVVEIIMRPNPRSTFSHRKHSLHYVILF